MYGAYYVVGDGDPLEGDQVATSLGWVTFGGWVLDRHVEYPECAHLCQEGWLDEGTPGSLDALEGEVEHLIRDTGDPNLSGIAARLLAALRARPDDCTGLIISDGEPDDE